MNEQLQRSEGGICSPVSVGGTEKKLPLVQELLDTINVEPGFLQFLPVSENEIEKIPWFQSKDEAKQNVTAELNTIPIEASQKSFRQWKECWTKCVKAQEAYFKFDWDPDPTTFPRYFFSRQRLGGRGSLVVKDSWLSCHEFEPNTAEDPPRREAIHVKSVASSNVLPLV
ncbi:hypothetical protein TNCV_4629301 [Trichonephila clavipes]|nr:hypothetical protein TNCV_4629301 [Trichonephila clavipes]